MLRQAGMLFVKTFDVFKPGDDALFTRRVGRQLLFGGRELRQFGSELIKIKLVHNGLLYESVGMRWHPRRDAVPKRLLT